jgi:hypothetical protein
MLHNMSSTERFVRILVGVAVLLLAFFGPRTPWAYVGIIPIITGLVGYCPLYHVLGRSPAKTTP